MYGKFIQFTKKPTNLCNIKKMTFIKSKKAVDPGDIVPYIIMFLVLAFGLTYMFISQSNLKGKFEVASPEISNKFAAAFVHTYLNQELTKEEKEQLNLNSNIKISIRDLYASSNDYSSFLEEKKREYLNFFQSQNIYKYHNEKWSGVPGYLGNLLEIREFTSFSGNYQNLDEIILKNNYYVIIIKEDLKTYVVVRYLK